MSNKIAELIAHIRELENQLSIELAARRKAVNFELREKRIVFEKEVHDRHKKLKLGLIRFLNNSPLLSIITSPFIYAMIIPLTFLDLCVTIYQWIYFSAWGIPRAKRSDYIAIDRHYLAYLNAIEKLNCVYCGYGNGVIAFAREVSSRTEQYWCPIKHTRLTKGVHDRAKEFIDYGDGEGWRERLDEVRRNIE